MNKTLLKRMATEVSVKTLGGLLVNYAEQIADNEEVTEETLEVLASIETVIVEMKTRGGVKPERKRKAQQTNGVINGGGSDDGSIRTESGQLQRSESTPAGALRLGNGPVRE